MLPFVEVRIMPPVPTATNSEVLQIIPFRSCVGAGEGREVQWLPLSDDIRTVPAAPTATHCGLELEQATPFKVFEVLEV